MDKENKMTPSVLLSTALLSATAALAAFIGGSPTSVDTVDVKTIRLWEEDAPGAKGKGSADIPTLTVYSPPADKRNGAAIVVCPGGGYGGLAPHEAKPPAEWLNSLGVTAFVLKYRLAPRYQQPVMGQDVARALRLVRARAKEWNLDEKRIGVLGFSAGGHLASTAATHFDAGDSNAADPIDRVSSRPDVAILLYPVITMTSPFTHKGSRDNLLGRDAPAELIEKYSNEKRVSPKTPPTFLMHTADDAVVPMENSLLFAMACRSAGVPVELHVYAHGPHGVGMGGSDPIHSTWPATCAAWMKAGGFLKSP